MIAIYSNASKEVILLPCIKEAFKVRHLVHTVKDLIHPELLPVSLHQRVRQEKVPFRNALSFPAPGIEQAQLLAAVDFSTPAGVDTSAPRRFGPSQG